MQKTIGAALACCLGLHVTAASAETWSAQTLLLKDKSPTGCSDRVITVTFAVEANVLKVSGSGMDITAAVGPGGTVKQDTRLPNGSRGSLVGKVVSREFEYTSYTTGCRYAWSELK